MHKGTDSAHCSASQPNYPTEQTLPIAALDIPQGGRIVGRVAWSDRGRWAQTGVGAMYAVVRRYDGVTDPAEAARRVQEGFIPLLREVPGFVC
jgi:hypothetical protein